ncbi:oxygenase MpaB family protein [Stenotrophomonas sp. Marseille-Q4652]|uniref:oxygenase MpaB family protein n=1 Tax=Stenotrophomonas sp. Marseille-Q4652 TaxID=2866595 RepID=UPI001CE3CA73|nr:oxygenase MpaB family protein [Stenotrophomonas sp. Marseille-Q4652]
MPRPASPPTLATINREAYIYFGAGVTVAWQLANPGVGRGVARHSRTLDHPLQRLRATMSYVYAVTLGTDVDRATIARHVNHAHRPVSGPGYNAFDQDLQLWVAATLYRGAVDVYELFVDPVPAHAREGLYREGWAFGRNLQVRDAQWPADSVGFDRWWQAQEAGLTVDDEVRAYFQAVLRGGQAPWYLKPALPLQRFVTRGLMTPRLRELFGLAWSTRDERNWQRFRRWAPRVYWAMPHWLRHWPARHYLAQLRRMAT